MAGDTTVYVISTGYMPTLAYSKDDFDNRISKGEEVQTHHGPRYKGNSQPYGNVIDSGGKISPARIRGSVAWYEYSTKIKDIRTIMDVADSTRGTDYEGELQMMGDNFWSNRNRVYNKMGGRLFHKVMSNIAPKFAPDASSNTDIYNERQLNRQFGDIQTWSIGDEFDVTMLERDDITLGGITSIDMYMRHPGTGDIHRLSLIHI